MSETKAVERARAAFCRDRRDPDHLVRWLACLGLRAAIEGWDDEEVDAKRLLVEAGAWKRGFRPPATYAEAMRRARRLRARGRLRRSGGL